MCVSCHVVQLKGAVFDPNNCFFKDLENVENVLVK